MGALRSDSDGIAAVTSGDDTGVVTKDNTIIITGEFVFAINDQELEVNRIEPTFLLAAQVTKSEWERAD